MSKLANGSSILEHDFVYASHNSGEFRSARIKLDVAGSHLKLTIESEHLPEVKELSEILNSVRRENLQKLRLDMWDDFKIIVKTKDADYNVLTDPETEDAVGVEKI